MRRSLIWLIFCSSDRLAGRKSLALENSGVRSSCELRAMTLGSCREYSGVGVNSVDGVAFVG